MSVYRRIFLFAALFFSFTLTARADIGVDRLKNYLVTDGSYDSAANTAVPFQSTVETLRTLRLLGALPTDISPSLQYLADNTSLDTEYLSRRIVIEAEAGHDTAALLSQLTARQNEDGGFGSVPGYPSAILDTAFALEAMAAGGVSLGNVTSAGPAVGYLSSAQQADGGWADGEGIPSLYLSALAANALYRYRGVYELSSPLSHAAEYLLAHADANGAIGEDFETAPALWLIKRVVADATSGQAVRDYLQNAQQADGSWGGDVYTTALVLRALQATAPGETVFGTLHGIVLDALNGLPLVGVAVTLDGAYNADMETGADGGFAFEYLSAGEYTLSVEGLSVSAILTQGQTLDLGELRVFQDGVTRLAGIVSDSDGLPLEGAAVQVGDAPEPVYSDAEGRYLVDGISAGTLTVEVSKMGYVGVSQSITLTDGQTTVFSPSLTLSGDEPGSGPAAFEGVVVDAASNQVLAGVAVTGEVGATTVDLVTDAGGFFEQSGLAEYEGELVFTAEGYHAVTYALVLNPGETLDLAQIRLRPEEAEALLPDLAVSAVSRENLAHEPQALTLSGSVSVTVENIGTAAVEGSIGLTAFYDVDFDGRYDAEADVLLGEAVESGLVVGEVRSLDIPTSGQAPFRDAPVSVQVESLTGVTELNYTNNTFDTKVACRLEPEPLPQQNLKLKWHWDKGDVLGPPVVGQLTDDNGDGKIDTQDSPDIIFAFGSALYAVRGSGGSNIWSSRNTSPDIRINSGSVPSFADIDDDGFIEIIVVSVDSNAILYAFEHDGELKWKAEGVKPNCHHGAISIADIDHDGHPEITYASLVFDNEGSLLWRGSKDLGGSYAWGKYYGCNSLIADVNLDGIMEVVAGRTLYDGITGVPKWHTAYATVSGRNYSLHDGYNAVANFDEDDFAEIVLVGQGSVSLLEHTGNVKWGPVGIYGGGAGGPPTIADFDNDGEPEIGVAGQNYYMVLETDGSLKWRSPRTQDYSSNRTGSSAFDFEADGTTEVLYADERNFYIYEGNPAGTVGNILPPTPIRNGSGTVIEYPIVVDLDNDGSAEVIVTSSRKDLGNPYHGVRVFESENDDWPGTRTIWNQHSYHIDNINDDGSVPLHEEPSWLTHNTYRLNTFPDGRDPLGVPDLTAGHLRYLDQGLDRPFALVVRIGNAGAAPSPAAKLGFYAGDPNADGVLLGMADIPALAPGEYLDIQLDNVPADITGEIYALADAEEAVGECDETNNQIHFALDDYLISGDIGTDKSEYGPGETVAITYAVYNRSTSSADTRLTVRIKDAVGDTVALIVENQPENVLAPGEDRGFSADWNTGGTLVGAYSAELTVTDPAGNVLSTVQSVFDITAGDGPFLGLRTTTDKPAYHTTDNVRLEHLLDNLSANVILDNVTVTVTITAPDGQSTELPPLDAGQFSPGMQRSVYMDYTLNSAAVGEYTVGAIALGDGGVQALDDAHFIVFNDLGLSLSGETGVAVAECYRGEPQSCTDIVRNAGSEDVAGLPIRQLLVNLDSETEVAGADSSLDLTAGTETLLDRAIDTAPLDEAHYACVLQANWDGAWHTLGWAAFRLKSGSCAVYTLTVD